MTGTMHRPMELAHRSVRIHGRALEERHERCCLHRCAGEELVGGISLHDFVTGSPNMFRLQLGRTVDLLAAESL